MAEGSTEHEQTLGSNPVETVKNAAPGESLAESPAEVVRGGEQERVKILREEIVAMERKRNPGRDSEKTGKVVPSGKVSYGQKLLDRLRFPSHEEWTKLTARTTIPSLALAIGSGMALKALGLVELNAVVGGVGLDWAISGGLALASLGSFVSTFGSAALVSWFSERERANRIPFGSLLTVNRSAVVGREVFSETFPELLSERYFGELHFLGMSRIPVVDDNPLSVFREGMSGLYQLALACERNDQDLKGIEVFCGKSPIVVKSLEKYGLKVSEPKNKLGLREKACLPIMFFLNKAYCKLIGLKTPERESKACLITRKALIENKNRFARGARKEA